MPEHKGPEDARLPLIRLTPEHLRKLLVVDSVVVQEQQLRRDSSEPAVLHGTRDLDEAGGALERNADVLRVLQQCEWTGRDYLLTMAVTVSAVFSELPDFARYGADWEANVALLENLPADLVAPFADWKRARLGMLQSSQ